METIEKFREMESHSLIQIFKSEKPENMRKFVWEIVELVF